MKTYIHEMLIRRRRERGVAYRPGTCQHVSVRGSPGEEDAREPWCECNVNGKGKLMRAYSIELCQK